MPPSFRPVLAATIVAASILSTPPASAQSATGSPAPSQGGLQLTPFVAIGDDVAPGGGVSLLFPLPGRFALEAAASAGGDAVRSGVSLVVDAFRWVE